MERLTKTINGVPVYIGDGNKFDNGMLAAELSVDQIRSVMCRLAAYEEIGMNPAEIKVCTVIKLLQWLCKCMEQLYQDMPEYAKQLKEKWL